MTKTLRAGAARLALCAVTIGLTMWSGCDTNTPGPGGNQPLLSLGPSEAVTSETVAASGGTIRVEQSGTPIDGMAIRVPGRAYNQSTTYAISYEPIIADTLPDQAEPITPLVDIDNGGGFADDFIEVTYPVDIPDGYVGIGYQYNDTTGELEVLPTLAQSPTSLTVVTRHFSKGGAVKIPISVLTTLDIGTGFTPGVDDWQFQNRGSYTAPSGNCSGMCISAMWYYVTQRAAGEPALWGQFQNYDLAPADANTPHLWQDDDMAFRLVSTVQRELRAADDVFDKILDKFTWGNEAYQTGSPSDEFYQIAGAFYLTRDKTTGKAKPVYLIVASSQGAQHAIICYKIKNGTLSVADPNFQGDATRTITYHPGTGLNDGAFDPYYSMPDGIFYEIFKRYYAYERIAYGGYTSVFHTTQMDTYWTDMEAGVVGDSLFVSYDLEVEELNGQGGVVTSRLLDLTADNTVGRDTINIDVVSSATQTRAIVYDYDQVKAATSASSVASYSSTQIELNQGTNRLGFLVEAYLTWTENYLEDGQPKTRDRSEWRWVDFRWVDIIFQPGAPSVTITSPTDHASFYQGDPVTFAAMATDYNDTTLTGSSLVWQSNLDGQLGTGATLNVTTLTLGTHTVTVTAEDDNGNQATDSVSVTIAEQPPEPDDPLVDQSWSITYQTTQMTEPVDKPLNFEDDGECTVGAGLWDTAGGTWTLNGSTITITLCSYQTYCSIYTGTVAADGSGMSGTISRSWDDVTGEWSAVPD